MQANPSCVPSSADNMDISSPSPAQPVLHQQRCDSQPARALGMQLAYDMLPEENATACLADAFDAVNAMFSGQMPAQRAVSSVTDENAAPGPLEDENQPDSADCHGQRQHPIVRPC